MKKVTISIALFLGLFLSNLIFAADDATGLWDYSEIAGSHSNSCEAPKPSPDSWLGILQNGDSFLIVNQKAEYSYSTFGSINSARYSYSDSFCEQGGDTSADVGFTLSSATSATGNVSWTWSGSGETCTGGHDFTLTKRHQNNPIYDASGKWIYTQSGFNNQTCNPSPTPPAPSGYFQVTQTENSVTAIDDQGVSYNGFIDGATYGLVKTKQDGDARTTTVYLVTLTSATSGSGDAEFVWDDNCNDCWGDWTIDVTKEPDKKSGPGIPILLLDD